MGLAYDEGKSLNLWKWLTLILPFEKKVGITMSFSFFEIEIRYRYMYKDDHDMIYNSKILSVSWISNGRKIKYIKVHL